MVDATVDIEVSGNIKDESIFPEPQFEPYTAYLTVTVLSFKGSIPSVWRDRGIIDVNEPFAILIHSRCKWSADSMINLTEQDYGRAHVFRCIESDESILYESWSDWVFRVAQADLLSHFNGDHFDMPYILCRLTGNSMRPMDNFAKPMRASRFPWMCTLWSIPMKPYWKRLRARDKRTKGGAGHEDNAERAVEDDGDEEDDGDDGDDAFADEDNLDPESVEELDRPPEEEITD